MRIALSLDLGFPQFIRFIYAVADIAGNFTFTTTRITAKMIPIICWTLTFPSWSFTIPVKKAFRVAMFLKHLLSSNQYRDAITFYLCCPSTSC